MACPPGLLHDLLCDLAASSEMEHKRQPFSQITVCVKIVTKCVKFVTDCVNIVTDVGRNIVKQLLVYWLFSPMV